MKVARAVDGTGSPSVARAVRRARKRLKLNLAKAAELCGVTPGTFSSWESARHGIRAGKLKTVSEKLKVPVSELVA